MKNILIALLIFNISNSFSQETFTRKDSLQGGLRPERTNFNVLQYDMNIKVDIDKKYIVGYNDILFTITTKKINKIQIDLFENMQVDSIIYQSKKLEFKRDNNAVFIDFPVYLFNKSENNIRFYYSGNPIIAKNAPWDGGFVFKKDSNNKDFVGVACQGTGASLWFPCKDSQSDEPEQGAKINITIPDGLTAVSNGRLLGTNQANEGFTTWNWQVTNPINSYGITLNIGDYVHFGENYKGLDLDYYVLRENEAKAKIQFEQVKPMMDCFQDKFGPYPFKTDGYKLVETSYLGMEHQSAVSYGNKYQNGYLGSDLSQTGIGNLFDFIIIHESGHEWFGNSITSKDIADMWIHEGFTTYAEAVFVECLYGSQKAQQYLNGTFNNIKNDKPIIGKFGVNAEGSSDMYNKGALLLNNLRHTINDDFRWWRILYKYCDFFRYKIIDTQMVIRFFNQESGMNLTPIFNQYLKHKELPVLEIKIVKKKLEYKWIANVENFDMPIDVKYKDEIIRLKPTTKTQTAEFTIKKMKQLEVLNEKLYFNWIKN